MKHTTHLICMLTILIFKAESLVDGGTVVTDKRDNKDEVTSVVKAVLAPSISSSKKSVEDEHMDHFSDTDAKSNIMNAEIIEVSLMCS